MPPTDLTLAARAGLLLLPTAALREGVTLTGKVLRFDPCLPDVRRAELVRAILARLEDARER